MTEDARCLAARVVPPSQAAAIAAEDARTAERQEWAGAEEADRLAAAARMREVQRNAFQFATGYSPEEWEQGRVAAAEALASSGYDPAGTVGSAAHPEVLIDGGSLTGMRDPARRAEAARAAYESATGVDALLARHQSERWAWQSAPIRRQRMLALDAAVRRHGPPPASHGWPSGDDDDDWTPPPQAVRAAEHQNGLLLQRWLTPEESARMAPGDW